MRSFYVESVAGACNWAGCTREATHRVMRHGKVNYGTYCKQHAERKSRELESVHGDRTKVR